jgi:hypothetical protein
VASFSPFNVLTILFSCAYPFTQFFFLVAGPLTGLAARAQGWADPTSFAPPTLMKDDRHLWSAWALVAA